jgi:hypothetical protein
MSLTEDIREKVKQKEDTLNYIADEIVLTDTKKEDYDGAISTLDNRLVNQINEVDQTLADVQTAYQARVNVGCRTDTFWALTGVTTSTAGVGANTHYHLLCTKLSLAGYAATTTAGAGTTNVVYPTDGNFAWIDPNTPTVAGILTMSQYTKYGYIIDNLHGIKYYDSPGTLDIGNTTVGEFIGTVGTSSTVLSVMSPYSDLQRENITNSFSIGDIITCDKSAVFSGQSDTIVGFGSAIASFTGISTAIGIGTTTIPTILLKTGAIGFATAPESDGKFVTFTVSSDPVGIRTYNDYAIPFMSNPFSPETLGIMNGRTIGIGHSLYYDVSGLSSSSQSWRPEYAIKGYEDDGIDDYVQPDVGADVIYYLEGFDVRPVFIGGSWASEGDRTMVTNPALGSFASVYHDCTDTGSGGYTCAAEETALTAAIGVRDAKEAEFASGLSTFNTALDAANALRLEKKNNYDLKIWGLRQAIGNEVDEINRYKSLNSYIDTEGLD